MLGEVDGVGDAVLDEAVSDETVVGALKVGIVVLGDAAVSDDTVPATTAAPLWPEPDDEYPPVCAFAHV